MKTKIIVVILAAAALGWYAWHRQQVMKSGPNMISRYGFEPMPALENVSPDAVLIFAPDKISTADAERTGAMADELSRAGIEFTRSSKADFIFTEKPEEAMMMKLNRIMNGKPPTVFVRGKAKANPSFYDVIREYKSGK